MKCFAVMRALALEALADAKARAQELLGRSGDGPDVYEIRDAMGEVMMHKVGIFRNADELEEAIDELGQLLDDCDKAVSCVARTRA